MAALIFGSCFALSEVWLPVKHCDNRFDPDKADKANTTICIVDGENFDFLIDGVPTTFPVPDAPTEAEPLVLLEKVLDSVAEGVVGLCDDLRFATYGINLSEGETFDPSLLGWQKVLFGDSSWGMTPISYAGDTDPFEFVGLDATQVKQSQFFGWVAGEFREVDSSEELVATEEPD